MGNWYLRSGTVAIACVLGSMPVAMTIAASAQPQTEVGATAPRFQQAHVGAFIVALRSDTQTLARLSPTSAAEFSFTPTARERERSGDGYNHVGDINLRVRGPGGAWRDFASAHARRPIRVLPAGGRTIAAADITASMGRDVPFAIERHWIDDGGMPVLRFRIANRSAAPLEIGALGMPMVFDNIITDRSLDQAHAEASFADPYIGRDAGYVQVTRLNGQGPALVVTPLAGSGLEAWQPLPALKDAAAGTVFGERSARAQTSEGFYDWTVHSAGYADREWTKGGTPWNAPTSRTLAPGEVMEVGVRFLQSPTIRTIEDTLATAGRPVAIGIPGYVVPTDQQASLFVKAPAAIRRIESFPIGALAATPAGTRRGWTRLNIRSTGWGRARLTLVYADGQAQTVSYFVTKPVDQVIADLGRFATTRQWFDGEGDPFGRSPGILTWDREANRIVDAEPRVWIAGMSDEGGAGSWLAAVMKQLDHPVPGEVARIERMIDRTIVGNLQVAAGPHAGGVKKSLFYHAPAKFPGRYPVADNWQTWASWDEEAAGRLDRAYNYPHVAAAHWVLYRLARNHAGLVRSHDWRWYLTMAYRTTEAMMRDAPHYAQFGLMEGDVFVDILKDLEREGMTPEATEMRRLMKGRADHWRTLTYPFGSEMAWDSTGQPEVYAWMRHFGWTDQADITREVILGYDPTVPHWGYNGNAHRYWDFLYAGKYPRIERQIHHYGSALNAVPLFDAYRADPADLHLLRVAYGGLMGAITNIDRDGFASAAFHAWPDRLDWDPYSGDYGMGFFGHAYAAATYLVDDPRFGWLGFGGNVAATDGGVTIEPHDGSRTRLFIATEAQWITLDAGQIARATYSPDDHTIEVVLAPSDRTTPNARLRVEATTPSNPVFRPNGYRTVRGAWTIPLSHSETRVLLRIGSAAPPQKYQLP